MDIPNNENRIFYLGLSATIINGDGETPLQTLISYASLDQQTSPLAVTQLTLISTRCGGGQEIALHQDVPVPQDISNIHVLFKIDSLDNLVAGFGMDNAGDYHVFFFRMSA